MKSSSPDRCPSWKIQTIAPNEAVSDSTFISSALTGSTTEPNARNSSSTVAPATISAMYGSSRPRLPSRSDSTAVSPPTSTLPPGGGGSARTRSTIARASADMGSPVKPRSTFAVPSRSATTVAEVTPGTVLTSPTQVGSAAGSAGPTVGTVTTAWIGLVALAGKSRSSVSATCRLSVPAGSALASMPPNVTRRNGRPSTSSTATTPTA